MGRALWIAFAAIFTSLLLYLAFVGHREQVVRMAGSMPDVLKGVTTLVERISLPNRKPATDKQTVPVSEKQAVDRQGIPQTTPVPPKTIQNLDEKPKKAVKTVAASKRVMRSAVSLSDVQYETGGQLALAGKAIPGTRLSFHIDGIEIRQENSNADGSWKLLVPKEVSPGQHQLEVSVFDQEGKQGTIVVLPFVKAGSEEIAALTKTRPVVKTQKIPDDLKKETSGTGNGEPQKPVQVTKAEPQKSQENPVLPQTPKIPERKASPGFSKLAKLARSQTVKNDVEPVIGVLPNRVVGNGPALVAPQAAVTKTDTSKRLDVLKSVKSEGEKPEPSDESVHEKPVKPVVEDKVAAIAPKTAPYTGYRTVTVTAGKGLVVVQPGNTLWDLAISIYGSGYYYQKLYRANRHSINNPQMIFPGQIIFAPDANPPTSIAPISPPQWLPPQ